MRFAGALVVLPNLALRWASICSGAHEAHVAAGSGTGMGIAAMGIRCPGAACKVDCDWHTTTGNYCSCAHEARVAAGRWTGMGITTLGIHCTGAQKPVVLWADGL